MLSNEAINNTIRGFDVEQKVADCLQDWANAGSDAVKEMMRRQQLQDDTSREQFVISLIGNLAWAATVFFPPAAASVVPVMLSKAGKHLPLSGYGKSGPTALTKIVSVLGAAVGSNTIGQLIQPARSLDWSAVGDHLGELVPEMRKNLSEVADAWIASDLRNHMIAMFSINTHPDINRSNDDEFKKWYTTYGAGLELRKTVWERFVFPVPYGLEFAHGQEGMKQFLIRKLTDVKVKYEFQYKNYTIKSSRSYMDYMSHWHDVLNPPTYEQWLRRHPFEFVVRLEGLPEEFMKAQDQRLRNFESQLAARRAGGLIPGVGDRITIPGAKPAIKR
jgi:hypothetical protein